MARGDYVTTYAGALRQAGAELFNRANQGQSASTLAAWLASIFPSLSPQRIGAMAANAPRQVEAQKRAFAEGRIPAVVGQALEVRADLPRTFRYITSSVATDPSSGRSIRTLHVFDSNTPLSGAELRDRTMAQRALLAPSRLSPQAQDVTDREEQPPEFSVVRVQERQA